MFNQQQQQEQLQQVGSKVVLIALGLNLFVTGDGCEDTVINTAGQNATQMVKMPESN